MPSTPVATCAPRSPHPILLALAIGLVGVLALTSCQSSGQQYDMDLVNAYRRSAGAAGVRADAAAMAKAQAWSAHMAATNVLEHTGGGSRVSTRGVSGWCSYRENVGYGSSVAAVHAAFKRSTMHRRNMLTSAHRIGTGVHRKGNRVWVTEIYLRNC